jgi:hypothetical protein
MELTGINADAVATKIGKSRAYVYARLKLLDLKPEPKQALREGKIDASRAILIARIPDTDLQAKALAEATHTDYHGAVPSLRAFHSWLRANVTLYLSDAQFNIADTNLVPGAGSCHDCPKHTKASPDLLSDAASTYKSDLCTDPNCYHQKTSAQALIQEESESIQDSKPDSTGPNQAKPKSSTLQDELKHLQNMVHISTEKKTFKAIMAATLDYLMDVDLPELRSIMEPILRAWTGAMLETTEAEHIERALDLAVTEDDEEERMAAIQRRFDTCRPEELLRTAIVCMIHDDPGYFSDHDGNTSVLGTVAKELVVERTAIKKQVQAEVRAEFAPRIQAIQARIDAQSGKPVSETKPATNPVRRKSNISADEAQASIAEAMQASTPAAFAIGQAVRITSDTDLLRIRHHAYAGREGTILKPYDSEDGDWVVRFDYHDQRLFLTEELI